MCLSSLFLFRLLLCCLPFGFYRSFCRPPSAMFFSVGQILKTNVREINKRGGGERRKSELIGSSGKAEEGWPNLFFLSFDLWPTKLTRAGRGEGLFHLVMSLSSSSSATPLSLLVRRNFWNYNLIWMSLKFSRSPRSPSNTFILPHSLSLSAGYHIVAFSRKKENNPMRKQSKWKLCSTGFIYARKMLTQ